MKVLRIHTELYHFDMSIKDFISEQKIIRWLTVITMEKYVHDEYMCGGTVSACRGFVRGGARGAPAPTEI